jgi:hypothetical protein
MAGPHDRIIAAAAKAELGPLGFRRKGRSRTWIADHGWWATVVEFQPSAWSKGSYLNVSAHWLWSPHDFISFDFGNRVHEFIEYTSDDEFAIAAAGLAQMAAGEAMKLAGLFPSVEAAAVVLLARERETGRGGWPACNAAIAAGLVGLTADAEEMFACTADTTKVALAQTVDELAPLAIEPPRFRAAIAEMIATHRALLRLPDLPDPAF